VSPHLHVAIICSEEYILDSRNISTSGTCDIVEKYELKYNAKERLGHHKPQICQTMFPLAMPDSPAQLLNHSFRIIYFIKHCDDSGKPEHN
jgi:hypothetical protein